MDLRTELIAIQRDVCRRLHNEIQRSIGPLPPALQLYYDEYERGLREYEAISDKKELMARIREVDIVYVGDYHTLAASQKVPIQILESLVGTRPLVLAMEMVHVSDQEHLDRYMEGTIDGAAFKKAIRYERTWGFEWRNYRDILEFAREKGIRVVGINSNPAEIEGHILERDDRSAEVIVRETREHPDALVLVFDGDLHVAHDHLPLIVTSKLAREGLDRDYVIVYQNAEEIYWKLAEDGQELNVNVVRLPDGHFCILNSTPIAKLQSYLNWEQGAGELMARVPSEWADEDLIDLTDQVYDLVQIIANFLNIDEDLDGFSVYTPRDLNFLDVLERDKAFTSAELDEIKAQIYASESYFIPKASIIYLADLSLHKAAEEATHYINTQCAGYDDRARHLREDLYYRAMKEALGFFGSKIVDHKRYCFSVEDFRRLLRSGRREGPERAELKKVGRLVLQHYAMEAEWVATGNVVELEEIYEQPLSIHLGVTHCLGYILGDKMYNALLKGVLEKERVRELFYEKFADAGRGFDIYMEMKKKVWNIPHDHYSRADRM